MKKVMAIWMVMALLCLPVLALAEQGEAVVAVDWTALVVAVIGTAAAFLGACLRQAWVKHVRPWLEQRDLSDAAKIVVSAVEALLGRYCGAEKWELALQKMAERGFNMDSDAVMDALRAAWKELDLQQIMAGEKISGDKPPDEKACIFCVTFFRKTMKQQKIYERNERK